MPGKSFYLSLFFIVAIYTALSLINIHSPGLYYDEIRPIPAALGLAPTAGVKAGWIPFDYIWPLKSAFYYTLLKVLPFSVELLRIPNVLFFCCALLCLGILLAQQFGALFAIVAIAFLALNPGTMSFVRADFLPAGPAIFLRGLVFVFFFRYRLGKLTRRQLCGAGALVLSCALYRLDSYWEVGGVLLAALWLEVARMRALIPEERQWKPMGIQALILLLLLLIPLAFLRQGSLGVFAWPQDFFGRIALMGWYLSQLLEGAAFVKMSLSVGDPTNYFAVAAMLALISFPLFRRREARFRGPALFCWIAAGYVLVLMFLTPTVHAPWHFLGLEPFVSLGAAAGVCELLQIVKRTRKRSSILAAFFLVNIFSQYAAVYHWQQDVYRGMAGQITSLWSPKIYELADFRAIHFGDLFLFLGWGSRAQVAALSDTYDTSFEQLEGDPREGVLRKLADSNLMGTNLYVVVSFYDSIPPGSPFREINDRFEEMVRTGLIQAKLEKELSDGDRLLFRVYKVSAVRQ
ncbi:MAG TPA: hypothetical protein VIH99_00020 [Bdellovibrionota bacterium]|jgi:hypothetical protein